MSELDNIAPGGVVQLNDAPASLDDATFDSLFPADSTQSQPAQQGQVQQPAGTNAQPVQQTPAPVTTDAPFLKGEKSVYKTADAAIEGINKKDATIEELRQRYALVTGIDPLTGKSVTASQSQAVQSDDYTANPKKYLDDLLKAAQANDANAYAQTQQKLVYDALRPVQPIISQAVKQQAVQALSNENPEIGKFVNSGVYGKTLEANPDLSSAIATAESDARFYSRLPGLYKLAYLAGQGMQLPELLKSATTTQTTSQTSQPQPVRTTLQPQTLSPTTKTGPSPSFRDLAGIKATIAEMEGKGMKLDF